MQRYMLECGLETSARIGRDLLQVGVQIGVGCSAMLTLGTVRLEVRLLHQQFGYVARALAGDC